VQEKFWQGRTLSVLKRELPPEQWESLCDGCGRCCLHKVEDETTGDILLTCVGCRLLDLASCRCSDYANRIERVAGCVRVDPDDERVMAALPASCAYRRLSEGHPLPDWHPLLTGDPESVHQAGMSMRGRAIREDDLDLLELDQLEDYAFDEP
jgi:uncharacterized cysteine cluster protein YcgN (CxxCxxCC family)